MSRKDTVREVLSVIDSVTCLYTELAKSYFLLGPFMAVENTTMICTNCGWNLAGEPYPCVCGEEE